MARTETESSGMDQPEEPLMPVEDVEELVDEEQRIRQRSSLLSQMLKREPGAMQNVERIIREHLRLAVDTDTGGRLFDNLALYTGEDNADFLLMLLARGVDNPAFLSQVGESLDGEVWSWVRTLLALYGSAIRDAYLIAGENPNGWRTVNRQVYYDLMSERWRITFEIVKKNGERTLYEEEPGSLLVLADAMLDTLSGLPPDIAAEIIDPARLEGFIDTCARFFALFAPDVFGQGGGTDALGEDEEMPQ